MSVFVPQGAYPMPRRKPGRLPKNYPTYKTSLRISRPIGEGLDRLLDELELDAKYRNEPMSKEGLMNLACTWLLSIPDHEMDLVLTKLNERFLDTEDDWAERERESLAEIERQLENGVPWTHGLDRLAGGEGAGPPAKAAGKGPTPTGETTKIGRDQAVRLRRRGS